MNDEVSLGSTVLLFEGFLALPLAISAISFWGLGGILVAVVVGSLVAVLAVVAVLASRK